MRENVLHEIWSHGWFDMADLRTSDENRIEILERGTLNTDGGPDFYGAKIRINGVLLAGSVEIHIRASDWFKHGHQNDTAYETTVLHVVYENDRDIFLPDNEKLAALELKNRIQGSLYEKIEGLLSGFYQPACSGMLPSVSQDEKKQMLEIAAFQRMETKAQILVQWVDETLGDIEMGFFRLLCRYMGFKVNADAMEILSRRIPLKTLAHFRDQLPLLEAYLLGQAGLLPALAKDEYQAGLIINYQFLQHKYQLTPMNASAWKWLRMRPINFPEVRLAQLAAILHKSPFLFREMVNANDLGAIMHCFSVEASSYWNTHYTFQEETQKHSSALGEAAQYMLISNVVVPTLLFYGKVNGAPQYSDKAYAFLKNIPAENNKITRLFESQGFPNASALDSQGMLGLKTLYCDKKRCLDCKIGMRIISK